MNMGKDNENKAAERLRRSLRKQELRQRAPELVVLSVLLVIIVLAVVLNRAAWLRGFRDMTSSLGNGADRTVTVYDAEGNVVKTYDGRFDVEIEDRKIKFDEQDGTRHIIVVGSGTVCIDDAETPETEEKPEERS